MKPHPVTRRLFIKESIKKTTALAATASIGSLTRSVRGANSPSNYVVLGLVGAGGRGTSHANGFSKLQGAEFKYICDVNDRQGVQMFRDLEKNQPHPLKRVTDMRRVFDDKEVDAVIVATPEHWHALATVWACQAGKDVYVEKNPSLTIWEGRKMIEAARKYRRIVQVGFQNRSAPYAVSAREYLRSGTLGKIVHVKVYNSERIEIYGTKQLMYLGRHGMGWQVMEVDGKVVAEEKGYHPDKWHQPNFLECIRARNLPNSDIEQAHYSACLVHFGNVSYRVGQKQLYFDGQTERFSNSEEANRLLRPAYRKHYRIPDKV
ncbi:MAG: Gfo/Idh/MocA family oxidoreductase [Verrucomicrobia bacterium]|nr:Gfo/Idh/MocA family oxidoreductase [Verrucomicrobiota bacterium]